MCVGDRQELVDVQALIAQAAIKRFNERVFDRLARSNEIELDAPRVRPVFERARHEFGAMINGDRSRHWRVHQHPIERCPTVIPDMFEATSSNGLCRLH